MTDVTMVTLSPAPMSRRPEFPNCVRLNHVSTFTAGQGYRDAWITALMQVQTKWFCFVDVDDELPFDFNRVLGLCLDGMKKSRKPLAYTNERVTSEDGSEWETERAPWSKHAFIKDHTILHHLVVCRTDAAQEAAQKVPYGRYAPELAVFAQVAKKGAVFVPEIGYIWHRRPSGLNRNPRSHHALVASAAWAYRNT